MRYFSAFVTVRWAGLVPSAPDGWACRYLMSCQSIPAKGKKIPIPPKPLCIKLHRGNHRRISLLQAELSLDLPLTIYS
ncbi:hypothetical protein HDV64DRAFT_174482 [Trichoderma sp. TUCIM 5745]